MGKPVAVGVGVGERLGAALGRRFVEGFRAALIAMSAEATERVAGEIRGRGGEALTLRNDATSPEEAASAYAKICQDLGVPEVLIYNGGGRPKGTILETPPEVFEETWRTEGRRCPQAVRDRRRVAHQDRSAWTHEMDLRPFKVKLSVC